jgi:hypothetical protein
MNCTLHAEAVDVATIRLNEGSHGIRVDYFENTGLALASLNCELVDQAKQIAPTALSGIAAG